ncbi:hypothetical protein [Luteitalea sp.]|jgi:hypothetical protein|uniref:hypothetical protein n=1 Tax=Luteitalea sp. TaxID=2004800 RepID=UPI0037CBB733
MSRTTIVLIAVFVVAASTPCQGAMATSAALIPEVPDYVFEALAAGLGDLAQPTAASIAGGAAALCLRAAGAWVWGVALRHVQPDGRPPARAMRRWA